MLKLRNIRNIFITSLLLTLPISSLTLAQGYENDQLLKMIPSKNLFCIRINNLDNALNQMDQFLAGASPMPIGISMLVKSQMMSLLAIQTLAGLNMNGSFAILGTETSQEIQPGIPDIFVSMLIPVTNYKQFIDSINDSNDAYWEMQGITYKKPADENGISTIKTLGNRIMLLAEYGDYALVSWTNDQSWTNDYNKMVEFKKLSNATPSESLLTNLDSDEVKLAVSEPIWIYGNIQQTSITFGPLLTAGIENIKTMVSSMEQTNTGISNTSIQNIMNMYISIIETLMKEVKSISLAINPKADVLNIKKSITTVPGTQMAKMFASSPSIENNLLPYLDDGAMMNIAFTFNAPLWKEALDFQINLFSIMSGETSNNENYQKIKSIAEKTISCVKGPAVYSFSSEADIKPPFKGKYIIAINDEKQFDQLITESSELIKNLGITDIYKSIGLDSSITINRNVDTYKGISIDSAKLSMKSTEADSPQAQMITSMYGDGFDYRWAIADGLFACTIGSDADKSIRELIDNIQSDETKQISSETKAALSILPSADKADFLVTVNVLRLFNMISKMMPSGPVSIPSLDTETKSNIIIAGETTDGKLIIDVALPKVHIQEIMTAILTMQQNMMMQQSPPSQMN